MKKPLMWKERYMKYAKFWQPLRKKEAESKNRKKMMWKKKSLKYFFIQTLTLDNNIHLNVFKGFTVSWLKKKKVNAY